MYVNMEKRQTFIAISDELEIPRTNNSVLSNGRYMKMNFVVADFLMDIREKFNKEEYRGSILF